MHGATRDIRPIWRRSRSVGITIRAAPDDELWFGPGPLPAPDELAARYGDPAGLGVHLWPESVRYLWLDRAHRPARKGKPPAGP